MPNFAHQQHPDEPIDILLVEDDPRDIRLTREAFTETDRQTTLRVVSDEHETVEYLTRQRNDELRNRPVLVLLDLNLSGRSGHDILSAIGETARLRRLPVVVLTDSEAEEDIVRCYRTHANAYVTKPPTLEEFVSVATAIETFWLDHARLPPSSA